MSSFGDGSLSGELSGFFLVEGEGGDVGGGGGHLGVDVAGVGGDVGGFGDGGGDVAVELDFVACPGGGIGEDDVVGGAEGVGGDAHVLVFVVHDDVDLVGVEGAADAGEVLGDGDGDGVGFGGGGAEGYGGDGAFGEDDALEVELGLEGLAGLLDGDEGPVDVDEDAAGGGVLGVGLVGEAGVDGGRECACELVDGAEAGADLALCVGLGIVDEGVVGAVDVAAFPHLGDGGAEFSDLDTHVSVCVFAHGVFLEF